MLQNEYYVSAVIGLVVSIILIKLGSGPAVFKFTDDEEDDHKENDNTKATTSKLVEGDSQEAVDATPQINKTYAMKKLAPVQNILGLSDDQMGTAINNTNEQLANSLDSSKLDISDNLNSLVDGFVFLVGVAFCCYTINVFTHGDFGRMLAGLFPVEAESLKSMNFLNNFRAFR